MANRLSACFGPVIRLGVGGIRGKGKVALGSYQAHGRCPVPLIGPQRYSNNLGDAGGSHRRAFLLHSEQRSR